MVTFKYRWMTAFGTSLVCHAAAIILISGIAFLFPPVVVNKGPIEVDLVSGGGGGGGGGSPDGTGEGVPQINPPTAKPTETLPAPADEEVDEDAVNDVHEISDTSSQEYKDVTSSQSANVGEGNTAGQDGSSNRGYGSGTGSGGGHGSGVGTGTGSGTGPGSGSGSGGGHGSGIGTGTGSGIGPGATIGPQILSSPIPAYPESARVANIEGTTVVGLIIGVDGGVSSAWVESSSGNSDLDNAAVNAVYGWQFVPAKQNGVAVEAQSRVPVSFSLRSLR